MLTEEQIKNLKPGDHVVVRGEFQSVDADGAIWIKIGNCHRWYAPSCVSLPSEIVNSQSSTVNKYDPSRLFKKGDKVRVVKWNGRHFHDRDHGTELTTGCICEVQEDEKDTVEDGYMNICVVYEEQVLGIAPCFLELVTPVEELEPYYVEELDNAWVVRKGEEADTYSIQAWFCKKRHPHAKAAVEAECARLNEEWRKEHQ